MKIWTIITIGGVVLCLTIVGAEVGVIVAAIGVIGQLFGEGK